MNRQVTRKEELTEDELWKAKRSYGTKKKLTVGRVDLNKQPIEFRLSFNEWLSIWIESGHVLERGLKHGQYCMSRKDDLGHYQIGNVYIQLSSENARQGRAAVKHSQEIKAEMSASRKGKPNGKKGSKHKEPAWNKGLPMPREVVEKASKTRTGVAQAIASCPHCQLTGGKNLLTRYHGDKCKIQRQKHVWQPS